MLKKGAPFLTAFCLVSFVTGSIAPSFSMAAPAAGQPASPPEIPTTPSAPPSLDKPSRPQSDAFQCQRSFVHKGKVMSCDSNIRLDGEKLRPILRDTPLAVSELNEYQRTRTRIRSAAYLGTLGLVVMIAGSLFSLRYKENGSATDTSNAVRNVSLLTGGGIAAGSFLSALSLIKTNEAHLGNAVSIYNSAHPESPIELRFSTEIGF